MWIIITIIILLVAVIYYLLRNKKNKQCKYGGDICPLADSDFSKTKTIPPKKCMECDNCAVESNGCCANCNANANLVIEKNHCSEHNHSHSHNHHHNHDHSHSTDIKEYFPLLFIPLILGAVVYRIINYLTRKNYGRTK